MALTEGTAQHVLSAACERVGLDPAGAELIRIGSNAVYRLKDPVIVRITRDGESIENAQKQVAVARWLEAEVYPAARALHVEQPVDVAGHVTTFWESASEREDYAPINHVAAIIRKLHDLPEPPLALPTKQPFAEFDERLSDLDNLPDEDAAFLRSRIARVRGDYKVLEFALEPGAIHGDANVGNVILDREGNPLIIDLDSFCVGPREWDLVQTALFYERFGWHTEAEYRTFVEVYGFDIMEWPGYPILADYREIAMTLWLCGKAGEDEGAAAEVHKRIESMMSGTDRRSWKPF